MHNQLITQIATDRQQEIARAADRRRIVKAVLSEIGRRMPNPIRPASAGGGMLPLWRHGSPARGS
jgi:hypothetical protein